MIVAVISPDASHWATGHFSHTCTAGGISLEGIMQQPRQPALTMEAAIGIIGLSLQLVDSAIKVKRVIGTYRSASKEIGRLAQNVEKVEAVAGAIKKCFEGDASNRRCSELIHTWGIFVLRDIQSTLGEIQDIIDKLEKRASKSRTLYTVGFSFLEKKDEIARLSSALDRNLNDLQHMMTAEIFSRFSVIEQLTSTPASTQVMPSKPELPLNTEATSNSLALNANGTTTAIERSDSKPVQVLGFQGGMQSTRVTKKMQRHGMDDFVNVKESRTYTFGIRGYSYRVEFGWTFDTLNPISYSLNFQHILREDVDKELYRKTQTIIYTGDLGGLQRMFSSREICPTTFMGCLTLYEFAIKYCRPRLCHFLACQNVRQCLTEE
ncbi:hypothetical protein CkaCkLH20_05049 [Colletotrichum karsti]|uniref:Fungal N-terminal domain-containing protein n=1 Tax=Colletotrichum karsti TaxID=1095194 RepID=A0A9P6LIH9_9PEZI|nr:uncharacterized protein CkaCkLH20_05049 [Colletotrichum karsti]KAF9877349.1 hypothetical protein CkaCkLH20_05049 [Colletotrichum karsti]